MTCTYDRETERFSECDGHHRCTCPTPKERTVTTTRKELETALSELAKVYEGLAANVREGTDIEELARRQEEVMYISTDVIRQTVAMMGKDGEVAA